jgi:spore coat protein U-like protein
MRFHLMQIILCFCLSVWSASAVHAGCRVSTTSLHFGNYDVFSASPATGSGSVTISCTPKADISIAIEASANSGSFNPRMMEHFSLTDTLNYNLYTSAAMVKVWGDGTQGSSTVSVSGVKNNTPSVIIYGKIFPLQNVSAGSYSEPLVVTVSF